MLYETREEIDFQNDFEIIDFIYHPAKQKSSKIHSVTELQSWFVGSSKGNIFESAFFEALEERGIEFFQNIKFRKNGIRYEVDAIIPLSDRTIFLELKSSENITRINYIESQWNKKNLSLFRKILNGLQKRTSRKFSNNIDFKKIKGMESNNFLLAFQ
ncbi:MAG: hypothetical protein ACP5T9_06550 [Thermoplasmata archaeon]